MIEVFIEACKHVGTKEITGPEDNPKVVDYFHEIGHEWVDDDETAWCAAFVGAILKRTGKKHSGKLNARSYLEIGKDVKNPELGDLVVLWRGSPDSWKGHVGFYVNHDSEKVYVLGGNQNNEVNVSGYNISRLLKYKRV